MTLGELHRKLSDITLNDVGVDLFDFLQDFFARQETKERIIYLNQAQNYERQLWRDGSAKPQYSPTTLSKRERWGFYIPSSKQYTAHETGELFRSMGVVVTHEYVAVVVDRNNSLGIDFMEDGVVYAFEGDEHIEDYFELYDPNGDTLGLTDESFEELREDMINSVLEKLKAYING